MIEDRQTLGFERWFSAVRGPRAKARVLVRIRRLSLGNPGNVRPVGEGDTEMRIDYGPGYRIYFTTLGRAVVVLLAGGEKGTQARDIRRAIQLARDL